MTTPEGEIEAYLVKRVRETGGKVRKLKWIGRNGAPDRMVWWPTKGDWPAHTKLRLVFVELKAPGKKPTKQQKDEHKTLRDDGFEVMVIDSIKAVDDFVP